MEISKVTNSFNCYKAELSYGELEALRDALSDNHAGPIVDDLYSSIIYHLERLPKPGEEEKKDGEDKAPKGEQLKAASAELGTGDQLGLDDEPEFDPEGTAEPEGLEGEGEEAPKQSRVRDFKDLDRELPGPPDRE